MVENYLKMGRFIPAMKFHKYIIYDSKFIPWKRLYEHILKFVAEKLKDIGSWERTSE